MENTNLEKYFRKIYTIAYYLTGDEKTACDLSEVSIENVTEDLILDNLSGTNNLYKKTIIEMFKNYMNKEVFLQSNNKAFIYESKLSNNKNKVQDALFSLDPKRRAALVWRDVLGYNLIEMPWDYKENISVKLAEARLIIKDKLYKE